MTTDLSAAVRAALRQAGFNEARSEDPGFHVWTSRRTSGLVYVEVRLHRDRFNFQSTPRWGRGQIAKYSAALTKAGFTTQRQQRIAVPRLAVTKPETQEAQRGGPDHG